MLLPLLPLLLLLLLLSTRDCAKSLVSRAGTVSRVHVSSRSGGWRRDGFAGPQPKQQGKEGGVRGSEEAGRVDGEGERISAVSWQAQAARERQPFIL